MCIIILDNRTNTSETLDKEVLERAAEVNPDGVGIMHAEGGKLHTWRSMDDLDELWKRYQDARSRNLKVAMHFRLTTKGTTTQKNLHPFEIRKGEVGFMHNGTIHSVSTMLEDGYSDSWFLGTELFKQLPKDFLYSKLMVKVINEFIGESRFLFMNSEGDHLILNPYKVGAQWKFGGSTHGVWFSKGKDLTYIISGKKPTTVHQGSYFDGVGNTYHLKPKGKGSGHKWWKKIVEGESAEEGKKATTKPKKASDATIDSWLVFDYGLIDAIPAPIEDDDLHFCGEAYMTGLQLWAVGCKPGEVGMPAAIDSKVLHCVKGEYYCIGNKDPQSVLSVLDEYYGYDPDNPDKSPYVRELRDINIKVEGRTPVQHLGWVYRYNTPLSAVSDVGIVPKGDWDEWVENYYEAQEQSDEESDGGVVTYGYLTVPSITVGAFGKYHCPLCKDNTTEVNSLYPEEHNDHGQLEYRLYCYTCNSESIMEIQA